MSTLPPPPPSIIRVIDFETTGLPEDGDKARICEVGYTDVDVDFLSVGERVSFFVDPGLPILPHIRAVHHISDADVAGALKDDEAIARLHEGLGAGDMFAAHNNRFEKHFIGAGDRGRRWIDTYRCALRAWPEHVPHSNQLLRYALGIDEIAGFVPGLAMPPHRAAPDAYVIAFILRELLKLRSWERLHELSNLPGLLPKLTFGKHYGMTYQDAPLGYLQWIVKQKDMDEDVTYSAAYWLRKREAFVPETPARMKPLEPQHTCSTSECFELAVAKIQPDGLSVCEGCLAKSQAAVQP